MWFRSPRLTHFPYEWDIMASLPTGCKLGILIAKALIQVGLCLYIICLVNYPKNCLSHKKKVSIRRWSKTVCEIYKHNINPPVNIPVKFQRCIINEAVDNAFDRLTLTLPTITIHSHFNDPSCFLHLPST